MTDLSAVDLPPQGALARLLRRKLALFGLAIILLVVGGAVFAPWLAP
ncbi:MAG: ABC transporter permease, partial [Tabrizicola sp.]|nr:ABC transporter permease [Tabrizicola sp.]